jgi:hypothetical protein
MRTADVEVDVQAHIGTGTMTARWPRLPNKTNPQHRQQLRLILKSIISMPKRKRTEIKARCLSATHSPPPTSISGKRRIRSQDRHPAK